MKRMRFPILALIPLLLDGCASQPLEYSYEGDVHLRWLEIRIDTLELPENEAGGTFAKVTQAQRTWRRLEEMMDEKQQRLLDQQLREFARILFEGVRDASGVPLVALENVLIQPSYDEAAGWWASTTSTRERPVRP
ncbi:MAG: hypothetical protein AAGE01_02520 [Pseudomonadota bacterium]